MSEQNLTEIKRSMYCGLVRSEHIGKTIVLKGWVRHRRDHGGLIFVDLIDRTGHCQVVLNPEEMDRKHFDQAHALRDEYVIAVEGLVRERPDGTINTNYATGEIELMTERWEYFIARCFCFSIIVFLKSSLLSKAFIISAICGWLTSFTKIPASPMISTVEGVFIAITGTPQYILSIIGMFKYSP